MEVDEWEESPRGLSEQKPLTVSQLNLVIKRLLEGSLRTVWIVGEVSDLSRPSSGHVYFTLKDRDSQIRAVIWRTAVQRLKFQLKDGLSVVCCGGVEVYPPRGSYQFIINQLQPKGVGPLQLAFQQLHEKLSKEGLFDPAKKRPLPRYPRRIGFVTSPSGAALHDFLEAARTLWSDFSLVLIPARVQGDQASSEIVRGIRIAHKFRPRLDLLIVGRGGGSAEDLWCFNDERVVRALAASRIPTVSAVGHEIDVTLTDLAADQRALTPTHAAQLILPSQTQLLDYVHQLNRRFNSAVTRRVEQTKQRLRYLSDRSVLARPHQLHEQRRQSLDETEIRLRSAVWNQWRLKQQKLQSAGRALHALSPLQVLSRGYSLTQIENQPITSVADVSIGDSIETTVQDGTIVSRVLEKHRQKDR